jgi:hypothetical protein
LKPTRDTRKPVSSVELSCQPIVIADSDEGAATTFVGAAGVDGMSGGGGGLAVVAHAVFENSE